MRKFRLRELFSVHKVASHTQVDLFLTFILIIQPEEIKDLSRGRVGI